MTLKEVAELAGVSTAAVSLYINGKADGRVSPDTQHHIEQALQESGYVLSQRTRKKMAAPPDVDTKNIALFWSIQFDKPSLLGDMLIGLQRAMVDLHVDNCNFEICSYKPDELYRHKRVLCGRQYHGIILANVTESDLQFLDSLSPVVPIVLLNRHSRKYHCAYLDSAEAGKQAAELIHQRGYSNICTVSGSSHSLAAGKRFLHFVDACRGYGMNLPDEFRIVAEDNIDGGIAAAREYLSYSSRPNLIFTTTDELAYGVQLELRRNNVRIPEDCGIFSFGFERPELTAYTEPPISVLDISSSQMAYECAKIMFAVLRRNLTTPQIVKFPAKTVLRESF